MSDAGVVYCLSPFVSSEDLNDLFFVAWHNHRRRDFGPGLRQRDIGRELV